MKLLVKDISKILPDGKKLLDNISFEVKEGEFVGILGRSGAGKTLTMRALNGLLTPTSGEIVLDYNGQQTDLTKAQGKELRRIRQRVGVVFQGFNLVKQLTALENVMIGRLGSINPWRSIVAGFTNQEAEEALVVLDKVGIKNLAFRKVASLSGGEMQRVAIARALFQNPILLLADEPIANLDPSNALHIMQLFTLLYQTIPVIGVFHQPELTARFCTRVIALKEGKIIYDGSPKLNSQQLFEIYGEELSELLSLQTA